MNTRLWVLVVVPATLIVVHASVPAAFEAGGTVVNLYYLVALLCGVLAVGGLATRRPSPIWPWLAMASTIGLWLVADLTYDLIGGDPNASVADVFYLGGYLTLVAGLWGVLRRQSASGDLSRVLDTGVAAVGASYLVWQLIIDPIWSGGDEPVLGLVLTSIYPIADAIVLILVLKLAITSGQRTLSTLGLGLAALSLMIADVGYAIVVATDSYPDHSQPLDSLWLLAYLGLAVAVAWAATHHSTADSERPHLTIPHALAAAVALMVVPAVVFANQLLGQPTNRAVMGAAGVTTVVLVILRFVGLAKRADEAHEEVERREHYFRVLALNASDVVLVLDDDLAVLDTSRALNGLEGTAMEREVLANPMSLIHPADRPALEALIAAARAHPGHAVTGEARRLDGAVPQRWMELRITDLTHDPVIGGLVVNARDITERKVVEAELEHRVFHDGLTGLANRALFRNRVDHALNRLDRHGGVVTVMFCDLDGFKEVNERLGQHAGDDLLRETAARVSAQVRPDDTVARLGSDEFAILFDAVGAVDPTTEEAVERVATTLAQPFEMDASLVSLSASIGVAGADRTMTSDELLHNADLALYRAKQEGGGRRVTYTHTMGEEATNRRQLEADLHSAVANDELVLHYQPLVDLATGSLRGFEALVRWNHPRRGLLMPGDFIAIAEDSGLIIDIGNWVLRTACTTAATWAQQFPDRAGLEMSVNLSARQLADPRLTRRVLTALDHSGMDPELLVLELTESVLVDQPAEANAHLQALSGIGIRIAIDDFGTGYSSLAYLQQFTVDIIKIDRGYVASIEGGALPPLVQGMLDLSRSLGAACIAEGIEELHQGQALVRSGCPTGQGYLFSRPVDLDTATALISEGRSLNPDTACRHDQLPLPLRR
ncbi:MAG: putative bifunctional diguanylate cyclase/phosphodiesterase [Acidimicrobiales bacterium]